MSAQDHSQTLPNRADLYSRSSAGSQAVIQNARNEVRAEDGRDYGRDVARKRLPSSRITGYKAGFAGETKKHSNGYDYPVFGPGAVTESHTARHRNMLANVQPVVERGNSKDEPLTLNNLYVDDPCSESRNWAGMFRHANSTFLNR